MATRKTYLADNLTCGERLIAARRQSGFSLEQIAKELKVPFKYIDSLEHDDLLAIPSQEMAISIARKYCDRLEVSSQSCENWLAVAYRKHHIAYQPIDSLKRISKPMIVKWAMISFLIVAMVSFLAWRVQAIFLPPALVIDAPVDNLVTTASQLVVSGQSLAESEISINNRPILADSVGHFEVVVDLQKGLNLIKITAKKRYSRTTVVERHVLFKD